MSTIKKAKQFLYTIGHSNRPIDEFLELLKAYNIREIVDVRTIPGSRHNPQFDQKEMKRSLAGEKIGYVHIKELGGLRHAKKYSINTGWKNLSFRGYADYMQTPEFSKGLECLKKIASKKRTVIMCAEAVPWRCHRSLIADALTKQKWQVFHIQSRKTAKLNKPMPFLPPHQKAPSVRAGMNGVVSP